MQQGKTYSRNKAEILTDTIRKRHVVKSAITSAQWRYENSGIKLSLRAFPVWGLRNRVSEAVCLRNIIATKLQVL